MDKGTVLRFYKRPEICQAILDCAQDKEIAVRYGDGGYGKRPDVLVYPRDVLEFVMQGASSFHCSEELWDDPMRIHTDMKKKEMEDLRRGWDLVLDIDCPFLEYATLAADLIVQFLRSQGITSLSVKFSGNQGFHIGVPFEAFPKILHGKGEVRKLFPEAPRKIAEYIKGMIEPHLSKALLAYEPLETIRKKLGKEFSDLVENNIFNPWSVLDIDTILISSRHLYRMPYSFNEKSGLVSIPIDPEKVLVFKKEDAAPERVTVAGFSFLDRGRVTEGEAFKLFREAYDYTAPKNLIQVDESKLTSGAGREYEEVTVAIDEEYFPPAIKKLLAGLEDGKKRALFLLVNFLTCVGWDHEAVKKRLLAWNQKNSEPLSETLIIGQVRYHKQQKKKILPPNFDNEQYYGSIIHGDFHDNLSRKFKNPVSYTVWRAKMAKKDEKKAPKQEKKE